MLGRWIAVLTLASTLAAGCLAPGFGLTRESAPAGSFQPVRDADGAPVAYAAVDLLSAGAIAARLSTDAFGNLTLASIPFDAVRVSATGFESALVDKAAFLRGVVLSPASVAPAANDSTPGVHLLPPVDLGFDTDIPAAACDPLWRTCGLSEPVVEVAGDGAIYASATCCIGPSPPVWVSRDGGAHFQRLTTPGVREAAGIEGDFAIDDAGSVYFTDILAGAGWFTSWDKAGAWRSTQPVPLAPLVDRPWVRAGAADTAYFLYNTGSASSFLRSTDGGRTWGLPLHDFPTNLGTLGQGPERNHLWVVAGMTLYESKDGGSTWSAGENVPKPPMAEKNESSSTPFHVPVVDETGRVLVSYDWGSPAKGYTVWGAIRETNGSWSLGSISPIGATHVMPWPAAGKDGGFVVAWYGADNGSKDGLRGPDNLTDDAPWYIFLAATHDAGASWQTARADAKPILMGPMKRKLLDFVQVDIMPDGGAALVYAQARAGRQTPEHTEFVRTTAGLGLAPATFPNGPHVGKPASALGAPALASGALRSST